MRSDDLVTVFTTNEAVEAQLVANQLHDEGIAAFVEGGNQGGFPGLDGIAVEVQVKADDADRARKIVRKHEPR